jgi:predicted RNase H-like HicB family nuclease
METERETDGRWIAEVTNLPGVLAYGPTEDAAKANAYALALRVIADRVETSKNPPKRLKSPPRHDDLAQHSGSHLRGVEHDSASGEEANSRSLAGLKPDS